jgi:hypothetical protein
VDRVLVGVEVLAPRAVPQPHEGPDGEEVHRGGGGAPGGGVVAARRRCGEQMTGGLFRGGEGEGEARAEQVFVGTGRLRFGAPRQWPRRRRGISTSRRWASGALDSGSVGCTRPPSTDMWDHPVQLANTPRLLLLQWPGP